MNDLNTPEHPDTDAVYNKHYAAAEREGYINQKKRDIANAELEIQLGESFKRLENNEDFKRIIEEAYIHDTRDRLVKALGTRLAPATREDMHNMLMGIGGLQVFLEGIMQTAAKASMELPAFKDDLAQVQIEHASFN